MRNINYYIIVFISYLYFQNSYAAEKPDLELPHDPILSINAQEQLFVKVFEKIDPTKIHPITTPLPDLEPMVRMHYSYVSQLVKDSRDHLQLLKEFWQQTNVIIQENQITLGRMRSITMQLALLLMDMQGGKIRETNKSSHFSQLYEQGLWKDIKNFKDSEFYIPSRTHFPPHPFYFEAILCSKTGGFSYTRFVDNYIERPFVMHLAALALRNKGVHGGLFAESADYLSHDFGHNEILALYGEFNQRDLSNNPQTEHLIYWDTFRSLLKTVRNAKLAPQLNEIALFLMLHEAVPSLVATTEAISFLGLPAEEAAMPLSVRKLFLGMVANSGSFTEVSDTSSQALRAAVYPFETKGKKPWRCQEVWLNSIINSIEETDDGFFTGNVRLQKMPLPQECNEQRFKEPIDLGKITLVFNILPTDDPFKECVNVLRATNLTWVDAAEFHLTPDQQQMVSEDIREWSYATVFDSRLVRYLASSKDKETMLRSLYKEDCQLPPADAPLDELSQAVEAGMKRFWCEFYLTNKHLFSEAELKG